MFYKKLEQLLSDSRTEVKRLEDENVQNYQQTDQLLQSMQSNEKPQLQVQEDADDFEIAEDAMKFGD